MPSGTPVPTEACDVAIVGGGPGGSAAALSLAERAPGLAVVLLEASAYDSPRLGETLPPPARRLLEHLDVWEPFARQVRCGVHREAWGTTASWGAEEAREKDFLFAAGGAGWNLDRAAFDAMLAGEAERRGVHLRRRTRLRGGERAGAGWRLTLATGEALAARFVVDATGSAASFARRCGARFVAVDRLVGFARFFADREGAGSADGRTLVEACADGWWYTAGLPGGRRVAAFFTDVDLARRLRLADPGDPGDTGEWSRRLAATSRVSAALRGARPLGPMTIRATPSRRLDSAAGAGWLAVGDAASIFDPLSSAGIVKALRSGIFAAYAVADLLAKGDELALERHRHFVRAEFAGYARGRARHYATERRWPQSEFWRRRWEA